MLKNLDIGWKYLIALLLVWLLLSIVIIVESRENLMLMILLMLNVITNFIFLLSSIGISKQIEDVQNYDVEDKINQLI